MALYVRDVMSRAFVTCGMDATIDEIARRICEAQTTAIIVVDAIGELAGIISRTDMARVYVEANFHLRAEDIMTDNVFTIAPSIPVKAAVELMLDHKIHQLVIQHERPAPARPVGMLSLNDVLRLMAQPDVLESE